MSVDIERELNEIGRSFEVELSIIEMIKALINWNIFNFDSFTKPLYEYTEKISTSVTSASTLPDKALHIPAIDISGKTRSFDDQYSSFIKDIQRKKMQELWDNDDDEEWEYV